MDVSYVASTASAKNQMAFQERMSNTAHQREVADLIKAGLNPVLSASLGGASSPSGATASGGSFSGQQANVDTALLPSLLSYMASMMSNETSKDIAKINADTAIATSKINSAATVSAAGLGVKPGNRFFNSVIGQNSGKAIEDTGNVIDWIGRELKQLIKPIEVY